MRYRLNDLPEPEPQRRNHDRSSNSGYPGGGHTYSREQDPYGRHFDDPVAGERGRQATRDVYSRPDSWRDDPQVQGQGVGQGDFPGRSGLTFPYQAQPRRPMYPKGYVRSDEYIQDDLCERLSRSGLDVAEVSVAVEGGKVTLSGSVPARWIKHAVEDAASETRGVTQVDNQIRVAVAGRARAGADSDT